MGRNAKTEKTGRKLRQLNASLPEQLVIRFNEHAPRGKRDAVLHDILESFLQRVDPDLKPATEKQVEREIERVRVGGSERHALALTREHAQAILEITAVVTRKGPKAAPERRRTSVKRAS